MEPGIMRVGTWGTTQAGSPQNVWSFKLEQYHKLKTITIDHGDVIYSLMFTTQYNGASHNSDKVGGWNGGETVSEVTFEVDEEITGINGTVGTKGGYTVISSLSFVTNKRTHGPFGQASESIFTVPWADGSYAGFYGLAGYYIDSIGVYMKPYENRIRVGTWGTTQPGSPQNVWSFKLVKNHLLKKITVDHGSLIYSLMFTTEYNGVTSTSEKVGGWNGGDQVSEVTLAGDEDIIAINGTVSVSEGTYAGYTIISSVSFVTNKGTHGPFGQVKGTRFSVSWADGSFAGFYGLAGYYIDSIGLYVKPYDEITKVGTWGTTQPGGPQNVWSFKLEKSHQLKKITIDHGSLIYSLMFTSEYNGVISNSAKVGGWNGGDTVSEVTFEGDEEITGINGTVAVSEGTYAGYTIIASISFVTNKRTHGPFGQVKGTPFSVAWADGSFAGFYGLAGYYIDSIGVYMKANEKITRVGTWGTTQPGGPQNVWSFKLEKNHLLKKITIDHGTLVYSLMFTTEYNGVISTAGKFGGWNGGDQVSEVTFAEDEEITGINGTIAVSEGTYAGYTIISSITFVTNKGTHGPFGQAKGTPFTVPWSNSSFAGFYGLAGYYIDSIGVYLKGSA